jgi:hypothetical protein
MQLVVDRDFKMVNLNEYKRKLVLPHHKGILQKSVCVEEECQLLVFVESCQF